MCDKIVEIMYFYMDSQNMWLKKSNLICEVTDYGHPMKAWIKDMLRSYLKVWDWDWIFGRAVKAISSLGVCSPWAKSFAFPTGILLLLFTIKVLAEYIWYIVCRQILTFILCMPMEFLRNSDYIRQICCCNIKVWSKKVKTIESKRQMSEPYVLPSSENDVGLLFSQS